MSARKKLGEMLIEAGLLDEPRLQIALANQQQWSHPLGVTLVLLDLVDEAEMLRVLGRQLNVPTARFKPGRGWFRRLPPELRELLPYEVAKRLRCLPLHIDAEGSRKELYVGMADPRDLEALDDIRFRTGMMVHAVLVSGAGLDDAIERQYSQRGFDLADLGDPTQPQLGTERDFELDSGVAEGVSKCEALPPLHEHELEFSHTDEPASERPLATGSDKRKHSRIPMKAVMGVFRSPSAAGRDISLGGMLRSFGLAREVDLKSAPAQKLVPLPVMITHQTSSSSCARWIALTMPSRMSSVMLLRLSGRFNVMVATWSATS